MKTLRDLSNHELLSGLESLLGRQRELLARLLAYLIEVERRRLHLEQAYSSLFEFCTVQLRMSLPPPARTPRTRGQPAKAASNPSPPHATRCSLPRARQTRAALEELQSGRGPVPWRAPLDQVLRAATQMLTR